MLKKLTVSTLLATSLMAMHNAEININDVDLEAGINFDLGQFNDAVEPDTTFVGFKYFNPDKDYSDWDVAPKDYFELNFLIQRKIRDTDFTVGLGVKLNYINDIDGQNFSTLPLTLKGGYEIQTTIPIFVNLEATYAPPVLSFQDARGYYGYRLEADFRVIENAEIYAGFRDMETKYDNTSFLKYNRSAFLGFRFRF